MLPGDTPGYTEEGRKEELEVEAILLPSPFYRLPPSIPLEHVLSPFIYPLLFSSLRKICFNFARSN